jgi:hypothetical protein
VAAFLKEAASDHSERKFPMLFATPQATAARVSVRRASFIAPALTLLTLALPLTSRAADKPFLPPPPPTVSTAPLNGDVNPYGTAFVPYLLSDRDGRAEGDDSLPNSILRRGDLLVSNFNNAQNLQGTGTTIVRIDKSGQSSLFFQGSTNYAGLSGALGVLNNGIVMVGNLRTADGTPATAQAGALQIISPSGKLLNVIADPAIINGPWGLAVSEHERHVDVFVSNVLNGTITRLTFRRLGEWGIQLEKSTVIATGLNHRGDPAALELGPSGLLYDAAHDVLLFASSLDDAIYAIQNASTVDADQATPILFVQDNVHLHGPLDLALAHNGHLLVANSDGNNVDPNQPSEIVEYAPDGAFVSQFSVDPNNGGAFGIATQQIGSFTRFSAVDDNTVTVTTYTKLDR